MFNKMIESINKKGYICETVDDTTVNVPFTNFVAQFHITNSGKYMVSLFDNDNVLIDYRIYIKIGFAIRFMMMYREEEKQREINEILES